MTTEDKMPELPDPVIYAQENFGLGDWTDHIGYSADQMREYARAYAAQEVAKERERCTTICDELEAIWSALKDSALLNGDVALSNSHAGEPRAARIIKEQILKGESWTGR